MDWEKVINWDEVPEDVRIYQHRKTKALHPGPVLEDSHFEEIKRPINLEDGAWYAFTVGGCRLVASYYKMGNVLCIGGEGVDPDMVKIHKKLTDDMWE